MSRGRLIVVPAGKASLHPRWFEPRQRSYDIVALVYDESAVVLAGTADHLFERAGTKWELLTWFFNTHRDLWQRYEHFWLPDDDLLCSAETVERLFSAAADYQLALSQPSLTRNGLHSHRILVHRHAFEYRLTNFVEIMCPLFSRQALEKVLDTFGESRSGWGLDYLWSQCILRDQRIGVIDRAEVEHTRPVNAPGRGEAAADPGSFYARFAIDPWLERDAVIAKYGFRVCAKREFSGRLRPGLNAGRGMSRLISQADLKLPF